MSGTTKLKRKLTTGAPDIALMAIGELVLNHADKTLHYRADAVTMFTLDFITASEILAGVPVSGDMVKATYDADNDGKVDTANNADKLGNLLASEYALKSTVDDQLDLKADLVGGKVPAAQLPILVDEMLEGTYISPEVFNDELGVPYVPNSNNYYVDTTTNKSYRWSGTIYTVLNEGIALGETSSTAYRGDRGKTAYDHSQAPHAPVDAEGAAQLNARDVENRKRSNHTEQQPASTISDFATKVVETVVENITIAGSFTVTPAHNGATIKVSGTTPVITFNPNTQAYPNKFSVYFLKMDATDATFAFTAATGWTYTYDNLALVSGGRCGVLRFESDTELILLGNE